MTSTRSDVPSFHPSDIRIRMNYGCALLADSHPPMLEGVCSLLQEMFEALVMVADEASLLRERYPELNILKRSAHSDLVPAVQEVLAGRIYVSPAVGARRTAPAQ